MQSDIVTGRAGRKRKDTERGGIERKRRDATSPLAAVAGGGTTARRATATGGTNTRRAKGARRVKRSARRSAQTKRTRRLWSSDCHLLVFLSCLSPVLSAPPPRSPSPTKMRKKEREKMSTDPQNQEIAECSMPLAPPSISILLHPAVVRPHHHFMRRMDGSEDAGKEGQVSFTSSVFSPSPADISQGISLPFNPLLPLSSAPPPSSQSTAVTVRSCSEISLYNQDDQQI